MKRIERQFGLHQKRRKRVTKEYEAFIVEKALSGRISSLEILRKFKERFPYVKISRSTIIRTLDENKFRFRKPRHIQFLTKAHKFNRYNFCLYMLSNNRDIFELILFSDECRFCNAPDNRSRWIRSNDFREDHCARYKKYTFGTMVWGAIGKNYRSPLVFPKGKINSEEYVNFLKKAHFFDDADQKLGKLKYVFQQDGATSHTTSSTYNYLEKHALILYGWPANSPDLSPIEMIWAYMKNILSSFEKQPTNQEELEEALLLIWNTMISQDYINNLIDTFENRLEMCCHVYGGSISHFLSAGRKEIKETDLFDKDFIPHQLSYEEKKLIYQKNLKMRHQWTRISKSINEFEIEPNSVKYTVLQIERRILDFKYHPEKYSECPKEIEEFFEEENASDYVYEEEEEQPEYEYEYKEEEEEEEEDYEPSVRWIDG